MKKIKLSILDNAKIYHVYDYYDRPICYSVKLDNKYYMVFFAEYYYYKKLGVWLYLPVGEKELTKLENSESTLGDYYKIHSNVSVLLRYEKDGVKGESVLYTEKFSDVNKLWLPENNATLG